MSLKKIAIIGGGAAGLMAAASLVEENNKCEVYLFEKNPSLGAKVIISGGGRCNVTTGITDRQELLSKYTRGAKFLKSAIGKFPPQKVMAWFEDQGVKLKTEADLRVFPVSNDGKDVVKVFERIFHKTQVNLRLKEAVREIKSAAGELIEVTTDQQNQLFDYVVLTTGGNAYRQTGSTGDGYQFAKNFGHKITKLGPSLNSFLVNEDWPKTLSGLSLDDARLEAIADDGERKMINGPLLFTHFGLSGPGVFALSSHLAFTKISVHHPLRIGLTPIANFTYQDWNRLMIDYFDQNGSQQIKRFLKQYFPARFGEMILNLGGISIEKKCSEISKAERLAIVKLLSGDLQVTTVQRRPGDEFVTAGGVALTEVNPKKLQSRLDQRLFFAGELLDVDGVTGGFNLQASWATGRLAAKSLLSLF